MVGGKVLILGGIRSGKSAYAESLLSEADSVRYVATSAAPKDGARDYGVSGSGAPGSSAIDDGTSGRDTRGSSAIDDGTSDRDTPGVSAIDDGTSDRDTPGSSAIDDGTSDRDTPSSSAIDDGATEDGTSSGVPSSEDVPEDRATEHSALEPSAFDQRASGDDAPGDTTSAQRTGWDNGFAARIAAHRFRRPASWETLEIGDDPARLVELVRAAEAGSKLLVEDLGGWAAALLGRDDKAELASRLVDAVTDSQADLVLVSPEVGLSVVPPTESGVAFADLLGELNQGVAGACDSVALVVAGQATWLKKGFRRFQRTPATPAAQPEMTSTVAGILSEPTTALPIVATGFTVKPGMDLPIHDDDARTEAEQRLSKLDIEGAGLGALASTVVFAAGTQGAAIPTPWQQPHMLLLHGIHDGDIAAGDSAEAAARVADGAVRGEGPLGLLAQWNGVTLRVVEADPAEDIVYGRATTPEVVEAMLTKGWSLADEAVDAGADLIMLGCCSAGASGVAATIVSRLTGAEIGPLLARIVGPDGTVDDPAWMLRCAAARDALHRVRNLDLLAKTLLSELAGPDLALAAGVILGATARRTAVLLDGPAVTAAALLARDLGSQSRLWLLLPDHGGHPTTKTAADVLGVKQLLDLKTELGEGSAALLALPVLRAGLHLSQALPVQPPVLKAPPGFEEV